MAEQFPTHQLPNHTQEDAHWHPVEYIPAEEITPRYKDLLRSSARTLIEKSHYQELSEQNPVSGLPNRRIFDQTLLELIGNADHGGNQDFAIAFIDLDGFKQVNDQHGHDKGDEVLRKTGNALQEAVRPGDIVVHFGGDEFAVFLTNISHREAETADLSVEELVERLQERFINAGEEAARKAGVVGSASVGIAMYRPGDTPESLAERADQAMYQDKLENKDRRLSPVS